MAIKYTTKLTIYFMQESQQNTSDTQIVISLQHFFTENCEFLKKNTTNPKITSLFSANIH